MKIILLAIGKLKDKSCANLISDYSQRLSHYCDFEMKDISDAKNNSIDKCLLEEETKILKEIKPGDTLIVLDERGESVTSKYLANTLQNFQNRSIKRLVFVVGGSYGLSANIKQKADKLLALSALTLTHELARVFLVEQLYRAHTILRGEKYHH